MPSTSTKMPPAVPIRLMIAFALDRSGLMVTSGISATAGLRNVAIAIKTTSSSTTNKISIVASWAVAAAAQAWRAGAT